MSDALISGRRFRVLSVIDDCNREALINEANFSYPAEGLVNSIKRLIPLIYIKNIYKIL
jgi:putative transposase